jgi:hypothetical protein
MPVEHYQVELISPAGGRSHGAFVFDDEEDVCRLTFRYAGGEFTAEASDYFETFCRLRERLEAAGWRPVCYGGSRDVYPSGMCRDMGRGLKAYRLHPGRPAGPRGPVWGVTWSRDGRWLTAAHWPQREGLRPGPEPSEVRRWDTATGAGRLLLGPHDLKGWVYDLALSPDGGRLATAHGDGTVRVWSVEQLLGQHVDR